MFAEYIANCILRYRWRRKQNAKWHNQDCPHICPTWPAIRCNLHRLLIAACFTTLHLFLEVCCTTESVLPVWKSNESNYMKLICLFGRRLHNHCSCLSFFFFSKAIYFTYFEICKTIHFMHVYKCQWSLPNLKVAKVSQKNKRKLCFLGSAMTERL